MIKMNYTKYVLFLIIFNCTLTVLGEIATYGESVPTSDISTASNVSSDTSNSASSALSALTYVVDTLFLILKVTLLAPYYSALFMTQLGIHPIIATVWGAFNGVLYAMWLIDLRNKVPFLR